MIDRRCPQNVSAYPRFAVFFPQKWLNSFIILPYTARGVVILLLSRVFNIQYQKKTYWKPPDHLVYHNALDPTTLNFISRSRPVQGPGLEGGGKFFHQSNKTDINITPLLRPSCCGAVIPNRQGLANFQRHNSRFSSEYAVDLLHTFFSF